MAKKKDQENEASDADSQESSSGKKRLAKRLLPLGLWCIIGAAVWLTSHYLNQRYQAQALDPRAKLNLVLSPFPKWFPEDYRGRLAELVNIPRQVAMTDSRLRSKLIERIESNPWVLKVIHLKVEGDQIYFDGELNRPAVAIACHGGFLLVDANARVIDYQEGPKLHPEWGIPSYRSVEGLIAKQDSLSLIVGPEFEELFDLVEVLWQADIIPRWSSHISEISSYTVPSEKNRFWVLETRDGPRLEWGWASGYGRTEAVSLESKLSALERYLRTGRRSGVKSGPIRIRLQDI